MELEDRTNGQNLLERRSRNVDDVCSQPMDQQPHHHKIHCSHIDRYFHAASPANALGVLPPPFLSNDRRPTLFLESHNLNLNHHSPNLPPNDHIDSTISPMHVPSSVVVVKIVKISKDRYTVTMDTLVLFLCCLA